MHPLYALRSSLSSSRSAHSADLPILEAINERALKLRTWLLQRVYMPQKLGLLDVPVHGLRTPRALTKDLLAKSIQFLRSAHGSQCIPPSSTDGEDVANPK